MQLTVTLHLSVFGIYTCLMRLKKQKLVNCRFSYKGKICLPSLNTKVSILKQNRWCLRLVCLRWDCCTNFKKISYDKNLLYPLSGNYSFNLLQKIPDVGSPDTQLTGETLFNSDATATAALLSIYSQMESSGLAYQSFLIFGTASDEEVLN